MKKKLISITLIATVCLSIGFNLHKNYNKIDLSNLGLENLEALANNEGSDLWFSNLRWVECNISKTNGPVGFYYKGVFIAAYATYTVYGNKRSCVREFTTNTCYLSQETPCEEIK